jgi:hypothetical protein
MESLASVKLFNGMVLDLLYDTDRCEAFSLFFVRWKLPIHGAVDGYSRIGFYLNVSRSNNSQRVMQCFREGVRNYGLPSRVR